MILRRRNGFEAARERVGFAGILVAAGRIELPTYGL
jgi:hypothetical protein